MRSWRRSASVRHAANYLWRGRVVSPHAWSGLAHTRTAPTCHLSRTAGSIAGIYKLRKSMEGSVVKLTQSFADKLCSEMTSYCPKKDADAPEPAVAPVGAEPFIIGDEEAAPSDASDGDAEL